MSEETTATQAAGSWNSQTAGYWWPPPSAPGRSGLAIASLVISIIALLGVVCVAAWMLFAGAPLPGSGGERPLTGQVAPTSTGGVSGSDLSSAVSARVRDDGGDVTAMRCPDTRAIQQGVVTVCHGTISGDEWAVVVYFEDAQGRFTLEPI